MIKYLNDNISKISFNQNVQHNVKIDAKNNYSNNNKKIIELENKLKEAKRIIEDQKLTITSLENKLKESEIIIMKLNTSINQKNIDINNLIEKKKNLEVNHIYLQDLMCITFISNDQKINYAVACRTNQIFAEIEEKLYKNYPEYRSTNNNFISKGKIILRFQTLAENHLKNGDIVMMIN